jgi:hypothetical protein
MQFGKLTLLAVLGLAFAAPIDQTALSKPSSNRRVKADKSHLRKDTHSYNREKGKLGRDEHKLRKDFRQGRSKGTIKQENRVDRDLGVLKHDEHKINRDDVNLAHAEGF